MSEGGREGGIGEGGREGHAWWKCVLWTAVYRAIFGTIKSTLQGEVSYYMYFRDTIIKMNKKQGWDAAAKKNRYKRSRDKKYEEIYIPPYNHTH